MCKGPEAGECGCGIRREEGEWRKGRLETQVRVDLARLGKAVKVDLGKPVGRWFP